MLLICHFQDLQYTLVASCWENTLRSDHFKTASFYSWDLFLAQSHLLFPTTATSDLLQSNQRQSRQCFHTFKNPPASMKDGITSGHNHMQIIFCRSIFGHLWTPLSHMQQIKSSKPCCAYTLFSERAEVFYTWHVSHSPFELFLGCVTSKSILLYRGPCEGVNMPSDNNCKMSLNSWNTNTVWKERHC